MRFRPSLKRYPAALANIGGAAIFALVLRSTVKSFTIRGAIVQSLWMPQSNWGVKQKAAKIAAFCFVGRVGSVDRQLGDFALRLHLDQFECQHTVFQLGFAGGHVDVLRQFVSGFVLARCFR